MPMKYHNKSFKKAPKSWYRKKYSVGQLATKAYRMAVKAVGVINSEKNYFDTNDTISVSNTWTVTPLTAVPNGTGEQQRVGDSIALKSLQVNQQIAWLAAGASDQTMRVVIFKVNDNLENTAPDMTELFNGTTALSLRNMDYGKKFTVLSDNTYTRDVNVANILPATYFKKFFNKKDYKGDKTVATHVRWNSNSATDYAGGHVFIARISNKSTNLPQLYYESRIRFYDN